jgi:hypothetical protein
MYVTLSLAEATKFMSLMIFLRAALADFPKA